MSAIEHNGLAFVYWAQRQPDKCIQQAQTAIELDPTVIFSYLNLGMCHEEKGMYSQAIAAYEKGLGFGAPKLLKAFLGHAYAASGDRGKAVEILTELKSLATHSYVPSWDFAVIYAALGEREQAIEALRTGVENRDTLLIMTRVAPFFDGLRDDPRFQDVARQVGVGQ